MCITDGSTHYAQQTLQYTNKLNYFLTKAVTDTKYMLGPDNEAPCDLATWQPQVITLIDERSHCYGVKLCLSMMG